MSASRGLGERSVFLAMASTLGRSSGIEVIVEFELKQSIRGHDSWGGHARDEQ
jgi:hypothetical protein